MAESQEYQPLEYDDGPLVWVCALCDRIAEIQIDCEMTGLDDEKDIIIEIAVIITNGRLEPVDEGIDYVINTPKEVLDGMNEWCIDQHGRSGLTQACLESPHSYDEVYHAVVEYIQKWIPEKGAGILAGSSVHADARWLRRGMPDVMRHLSYRIVDVSSIKEICKRWYPSVTKAQRNERKGEAAHRALDDIKGSIRELEHYRNHIFIPLEPPRSKSKPPSPTSKSASKGGADKKVNEVIKQLRKTDI